MSTRYLLDTSVLLLVLKKDALARHKIAAIGTENAYVTSISLGDRKEMSNNCSQKYTGEHSHEQTPLFDAD